MKRSLLFLFALYTCNDLLSQTTDTTAKDTLKTLNASRVASAPKIDGLLDDEVWKNAEAATDFIQNYPLEGHAVSQKTEVKIIYDNYAIYVGAMMYDLCPDSIVCELGNRDDNGLNAENFRFVIDPYNTRQDGYVFGVYSSGVQFDGRFSDGTYNAVWQSSVSLHEKGWSVEMKIPYSAIRFPKNKEQKWGLELTRKISRTNEFVQWALTPAGKPNFMDYWGTLTGISDIQPPVRLSLTPYLSSYYEIAPDYNPDGTFDYANSFSYNAGADIKYGIDERFTVDMTLLPDFGQVQSDNKVKNISYQETFYQENRSFFKEGTELFDQGMFYTRRIGRTPSGFYSVPGMLNSGESIEKNPTQAKLLNATKLSGRTNSGMGIGLFNAVTDNTYAVVHDTLGNRRKILTEPLTNYNAIVFDQQLKNSSNINFMNTNVMREGNSYRDANVTNSNFSLRNKKNTWSFDGGASLSQIFRRNDSLPETFSDQMGYSYFIGINKISGIFQYSLSHEALSSTFDRNDMGYLGVNNFKGYNANIAYNRYKPWKFLLNSYNNLNIHYGQNFISKLRTDLSLNLNLNGQLKNYWNIWFGTGYAPLHNREYYEPRTAGRYSYNLEGWWSWIGLNTDPRKKFGFNFNVNTGAFNKKNYYNLEAPLMLGFNTMLRMRVNDKFSLSYFFNFNWDPNNLGYANKDSMNNIIYGERILHTYENTVTARYIFKNDLSFSLNARHYWNTGEYIRYYTLLEDGMLERNYTYSADNNFSYNAFTIDAVFSWQFAPGSQLSIVYKNVIEKDEQIILPKFSENFSQTLSSPQTNSLSLKVLYYLDYQYLKRKKVRGQK